MKINKIEKDVPIPIVQSRFDYPWDKMEIGDSVFTEPEEGQSLFELKRIVGPSASYFGNVTGKKFKSMMMREENGIRTWRIE